MKISNKNAITIEKEFAEHKIILNSSPQLIHYNQQRYCYPKTNLRFYERVLTKIKISKIESNSQFEFFL